MPKTKAFIEKARAKHGDRYDYSESVYRAARLNISIKCEIHGVFNQLPTNHLNGKGCRQCGIERRAASSRMTLQEFKVRARKAHGDKFCYSQTVMNKTTERVVIICPHHGEFQQFVSNHLRGAGCAICAGNAMGGTENFIRLARNKHGETYNYAKTIYVDSHSAVTVTCSVHGDFKQSPTSHLSGRGCRKCGVERTSSLTKGSTDAFIARAKSVHGDRYDYSKVDYTRNSEKVTIICRQHGEYSVTPANHVKRNCPKCGQITLNRYKTDTRDEFIRKAVSVHGDLYDYSLTDYNGFANHVSIACKVHGAFMQSPPTHLRGSGCPRCPKRFSEPTNLYIMQNTIDQIKIGYSIDPSFRLARLQRDQPFTAELLHTWTLPDTPAARAAETAIHERLAGFNAGLSGFDGATEWFDTTAEYAMPIIEKIVTEHLQAVV